MGGSGIPESQQRGWGDRSAVGKEESSHVQGEKGSPGTGLQGPGKRSGLLNYSAALVSTQEPFISLTSSGFLGAMSQIVRSVSCPLAPFHTWSTFARILT